MTITALLLEATWVAERKRHLKYRRLFRHEQARRVFSDESFVNLRRQFDAEINAVGEMVSAVADGGYQEEQGEASPELMRGYLMGLKHAREMMPTEDSQQDASQLPHEEPTGRSRHHLKLIKSPTEEAS